MCSWASASSFLKSPPRFAEILKSLGPGIIYLQISLGLWLFRIFRNSENLEFCTECLHAVPVIYTFVCMRVCVCVCVCVCVHVYVHTYTNFVCVYIYINLSGREPSNWGTTNPSMQFQWNRKQPSMQFHRKQLEGTRSKASVFRNPGHPSKRIAGIRDSYTLRYTGKKKMA